MFSRLAVRAPSAARAFSTTQRSSMAKMTIIGRLAASPEVTATSTGHEITRYSVASNSGTKENPKTSWFNIASFAEEGPRRDFITGLEKGTLVYVEGDAKMDSYEDKETGKTRQSLSIVQRNIEVLSRPRQQE